MYFVQLRIFCTTRFTFGQPPRSPRRHAEVIAVPFEFDEDT
jgi:hypothetical protein